MDPSHPNWRRIVDVFAVGQFLVYKVGCFNKFPAGFQPSFRGIPVCQKTFLFTFNCSEKVFKTVKKQFVNCGIEPKVHGNVQQTGRAKSFDIVIIKLRWSEEVWRTTVLWVRNRVTLGVTLKGLISVCGKVTIEGVIPRWALDFGFIIWPIIARARLAVSAVAWSCWWSSWSSLLVYRLKTSDNYYYQIMCQLAVAGLTWCDFFIYLASDEYHLETIYFDQDFWKEAQAKVDSFSFLTFWCMAATNCTACHLFLTVHQGCWDCEVPKSGVSYDWAVDIVVLYTSYCIAVNTLSLWWRPCTTDRLT